MIIASVDGLPGLTNGRQGSGTANFRPVSASKDGVLIRAGLAGAPRID